MRSILALTVLIAIAAACTNYKVTATSLNIRTAASTSASVSRTASQGTTLCVDSISNGWAKLSDGKYCSSQYLEKIASASCTNYKTTAALNIRSGPGASYAIARTSAKGATLCVVSINNGWAKLSDGYYASASYLTASSGSSSSTPAAPSCTNYESTADSLNIRSGASTSNGIVRTVSYGTTLCVVSISNGWAKLSDGNYCSADYLAKAGTSSATASGGSLNIVQKTTPNKSSRNGHTPDVIVCHITEGSYAGAVSWLCNTASEASCHYVVSKKGEVSQLVPLDMASWCQGYIQSPTSSIVQSRGSLNPNRYCVGIEHEGVHSECKGCLTEAQKQASGKLIKHIVKEVKRIYGNTIPIDRTHIIGHYQIDSVGKPNCPGANFPWNDVIAIANSA